eukprot:UN01506
MYKNDKKNRKTSTESFRISVTSEDNILDVEPVHSGPGDIFPPESRSPSPSNSNSLTPVEKKHTIKYITKTILVIFRILIQILTYHLAILKSQTLNLKDFQ